ncbi:MAG: hypothetical protein HDT36_03430 [Clostridiales bacterium]|nr:hypothetical protein [Clostridiales bacterium]
MYLEDMSGIAVLFDDEEFSTAYKTLYNIVERHLKTPYNGEIIDYYVMVEQLVREKTNTTNRKHVETPNETAADKQPPNTDS